MKTTYTFPYTHDDVMQALTCLALLPESGMDRAASELWQDHQAGRESGCGWVDGEVAHLVGGPCEMRVSLAALRLLAVAHQEVPVRGIALRDLGGHALYDLRGGER